MCVSPVFADSYAQTAEKAIKVGGYAKSFYDCATNPTVEQCAESGAVYCYRLWANRLDLAYKNW
jgi:hypothetical protein